MSLFMKMWIVLALFVIPGCELFDLDDDDDDNDVPGAAAELCDDLCLKNQVCEPDLFETNFDSLDGCENQCDLLFITFGDEGYDCYKNQLDLQGCYEGLSCEDRAAHREGYSIGAESYPCKSEVSDADMEC